MSLDEIPASHLNHAVAEAWRAMPYEAADAVWDRLRHGVKWQAEEDGDQVLITFADGSPWFRMPLSQLLIPPPKFEYA